MSADPCRALFLAQHIFPLIWPLSGDLIKTVFPPNVLSQKKIFLKVGMEEEEEDVRNCCNRVEVQDFRFAEDVAFQKFLGVYRASSQEATVNGERN